MRLSIADRPLRAQLSSDSAMRASWGKGADQVQLCLGLLDAAAVLGDLVTFACLSIRVVPEGVLVTYREATIAITPLDQQGHQINTNNAWPAGLPPTVREADRARIDRLQLQARASSTSGRVR